MSVNPETLLTKKIRKYVETNEDYCYKFKGDEYTEIGTPDLLCTIKGRFIGIEVKVGNNTPSAIQHKQLELLNRRGAIGFWVNENNWKKEVEKVYNLLKEVK